MGDLGVYLRAVGFIAALATARYEMSLPLPKNDTHSFLLYRISLKIAVFMLLACSLIGAIYLTTQPFSLNQLLFVVLTLLSAGFMILINLGTNWSIRKKQFRMISISKMLNSTISNGLRWWFGILNMGSLGLLYASLIGFVVSSFSFLKDFGRLNKEFHHLKSKRKSAVLIKEYRQFPLVSLPHVLLDLGRDLLIATLIISFFSKDIFGSFNHSYTILKLPLVVIGTSIGQVFFNKCSEMVNNGERIDLLLAKTLKLLLVLAILPFAVIFFFGENLFSFIFSEAWAESGYFSEIMAVWLLFNFLNSPVSSIPMILNRQKEYFILGLISTLMQLIGFGVLPLVIGTEKDDFIFILWIVSISQAIYLIFITLITVYYAKLGVKKMR